MDLNPLRSFERACVALCIVLVICAFFIGKASAQGTFVASPATGNAPLSTTLQWSAASMGAGTTCVASGSWNGSKTFPTGTQTVNALLNDATYTMTCTTPGKAARPAVPAVATLQWNPPTQNTDGSTLTNLAGYRIYYGTSASALTQMVQVANASVSTYIVEVMGDGTYYFTVRAYNAAGVESVNSNIANKVMDYTPAVAAVAPVVWTKTVNVTVNAQPNPPLLSIDTTAYRIDIGYADQAKVRVAGTVPLNTRCITTPSQFTGEPVDYLGLNMVPRTKLVLPAGVTKPPMQVWVRCRVQQVALNVE